MIVQTLCFFLSPVNIYNRNSLYATFLHPDFMLIDFYHAQKGKKLEEMKIILRQILQQRSSYLLHFETSRCKNNHQNEPNLKKSLKKRKTMVI